MADDQLKELFGSDSDEDALPQAKPANGDGEVSAEPAPADKAAGTREAQMKDLFGSDDEEEGVEEPGAGLQEPSGAGAINDYDDYQREG